MIPWIHFEVIFLNPPFFLISHLNSSSNLTKFQKISRKYLNSLWIQPLFTIIPFNSLLIPQIGKFGIIFDTRPCEIDDLTVSSRHNVSSLSLVETPVGSIIEDKALKVCKPREWALPYSPCWMPPHHQSLPLE